MTDGPSLTFVRRSLRTRDLLENPADLVVSDFNHIVAVKNHREERTPRRGVRIVFSCAVCAS